MAYIVIGKIETEKNWKLFNVILYTQMETVPILKKTQYMNGS